MSKTSFSSKIASFFNSGTASGVILLFFVVISMALANSPLSASLEQFLNKEWGWESDTIFLRYSFVTWVNDGLMTIFFLLVGLEIKREMVKGELSSPKKAALPILAAIGGVLFPAGIYAIINHGTETAIGWGIPMATDIAFAIAIVTMLGKKVPLSLKVFLSALAIVDDLMAIIVIAVFYSTQLEFTYLLTAFAIFGLLLLMNKLGVRKLYLYLIPGVLIWYFIHLSGIHATIAGVLIAIAIPIKKNSKGYSPLEGLEHSLALPVGFIIMPIFAFCNTNIHIEAEMIEGLFTPLGFGIVIGLLIGKPIGISLLSYIGVKTGLCSMPDRASWKQVIGVGMLAGIGFTMSIFIAVLSFSGNELLLPEAKLSILIASLLSGILGSILLTTLHKSKMKAV
ncbi:MAG TPA: Na+/H+ antiporter NhaA [Candidatus Sphingobacterium stercoripullorum]|uniref:Na(+)/H(+) antiporter NhaA n=1 Tax=Candidatus Sphingobacterium stercoripullorum TaxID=2838759 RepID=A0A9D1W8T6_9SPHI|nr:Na+/H+ antiporter NhaA [Candidatus Sphingobacterium stercoripullorum]